MTAMSRFGQQSRSWGSTALLGLALLAATALTVETVRSARSARAMADAVVRDYSTFAAFQFARAAEAALASRISLAVERARHEVDRHQSGAGPNLKSSDCDCPTAPATTSRFAVAHGGLAAALGDPPADAIVATALEQLAAARPRAPVTLHLIDTPAGPRAVAIQASPAIGRAIGAVLAPQAIGAILQDVFASTALLPPALVARAGAADAFRVRVVDAANREVFTAGSGAGPASRASAEPLPAELAGLRVEVAVHPDRASTLVIGGLPTARWPVTLALLVLSTGLVMLAVVQMRREVRFARRQADFVSGVSHELRTPLAQIRLYGETLQLGRVRSPDEARRAAEIIVQESRRLGALVDTVLCFSRLRHEAIQLAPAETDAGALATAVIESFEPFAAARDVTIALDAGAARDAVRLDRDAFRQILLNLLDNAVKYGPVGQTVRVALSADASRVTLAVEDEGPGVDATQAGRIWDAFWRAPGSAEGGSGLGLSIVRELARRHGGDARVETRAGGGARFVVDLAGGATARATDTAVVPA